MVVHDKFHVVKYLNKGIDETRKQEVKTAPLLKKAKYLMLKTSDHHTDRQRARFEEINQANLDTAKAWRMRANFMGIYDCPSKEEASAYFERWKESVMKSNIEPMKKAAKTLSNFKGGIVNTITYKISNGMAEGFNSKIQKLNQIANGYRNYNNLRIAILFFNGKLNLFSQS